MIRYPDALIDLDAAIEAEAPGWLARARTRTDRFAELGEYTEKITDPLTGTLKTLEPFWGEVKAVYRARQHSKCLYCEKKLEGRSYAAVEWDLEHFRPKSRVRVWPPKKSPLHYDSPLGDASESGYFLLTYHPHNYGAACKTCNTAFKSDYFPVAGARVTGRRDPADYLAEAPYVPYPLGSLDEDPEDLITFHGVRAIPRYDSGLKERRGRVTIDFLGLNRDGLIADRAWWLLHAVWPNAELAAQGDPQGVKNQERLRRDSAPFANCTRAFLELIRTDRPAAEQWLPLFEAIVDTMEG